MQIKLFSHNSVLIQVWSPNVQLLYVYPLTSQVYTDIWGCHIECPSVSPYFIHMQSYTPGYVSENNILDFSVFPTLTCRLQEVGYKNANLVINRRPTLPLRRPWQPSLCDSSTLWRHSPCNLRVRAGMSHRPFSNPLRSSLLSQLHLTVHYLWSRACSAEPQQTAASWIY